MRGCGEAYSDVGHLCPPSWSLHLYTGGVPSGLAGVLTVCIVCPWPPELLCLPNHMQASVSRSYLRSLGYPDTEVVIPTLNESYQCQPQITASQVTFKIPYSGCGTIEQVSLGLPTLSPTETEDVCCFLNSGEPKDMMMVYPV